MNTPDRWKLLSSTLIHLFLTVFPALLFLHCAEVQSPPGGAVDKTNPIMIKSEPENGSVNVPIDNKITLYFSEKIVSPSTGRAIFISPRPSSDPKIKWKGDRAEITLPENFNANETYIISASSNITDLRRNKLDSASTVAFATGPSIDSGHVEGQVLSGGNPRPGLLAALYYADSVNDSTVFDSLYPVYFAQTNTEGRFSFQYLPEKNYQVVLFDDKNQDELFNPNREPFALSDRKISPGKAIPLDNLLLSVTSQDTLLPGVLSVIYTADQLLRIRLSRNIGLEQLRKNPANVLLIGTPDTSVSFSAKSILEIDSDLTATLTCRFGNISTGKYQLRLVYDSIQPPLIYSDVEVKDIEDKTPPVITKFVPDQPTVILRELDMQLVFSGPLDTTQLTDETFVLWQEPDVPVRLERIWADDFRLRFDSPDIEEGKDYRLSVTEFDLVDHSGNVVGDSLREYKFAILDSKSFGAISGEVIIRLQDKADDPVQLTLKNLGSNQTTELIVLDSTFNVAVPSGRYFLYGYIDSDEDGKLGSGSIHPFRLAETQMIYPDTISVRERFETAGIVVEFK